MRQLTITVPDNLAIRLQPMQPYLTDILEYGLRFFDISQHSHELLIDFLLQTIDHQEILVFSPPESINNRIQELLANNQHGRLTLAEETVLDLYISLNHLMTQLKAQARLQSS